MTEELTEWWCYGCSYDFSDTVGVDGEYPACPRCGKADNVEPDDGRN